jgi:RNA polymerase sigma factor (TIGR02999 family)
MSEVTKLINVIRGGDCRAAEQLLPLVYNELRHLAAHKLAGENPNQTLQATALVHEAYLRLVQSEKAGWDGRGHFFAAAAEAMRRILVENARRKQSLKRGGDRERLELDRLQPAAPEIQEDLLALDEALNRLAEKDPVAAKLVQARYFAGCTLAEAAQMLEMSPRTAGRLWAYARAWLRREISDAAERTENP